MSEMTQFLHTLRGDPFDPLPRLVYADWLEENDDPDQAELIRLQVRARIWIPDPLVRDPLFARVRELSEAVLARTLARFPDPAGVRLNYRAGLIDISCGETSPPPIDVPEVGIVRLFPRQAPADAENRPPMDPLAWALRGMPEQWLRDASCVVRLNRAVRGVLPSDPRVWANSLGMRLVPLPPGTFVMGSLGNERGHDLDEFAHSITLEATNRHIGIWPVTQKQYADITGRNPSIATATGEDASDNPVQYVSHDEAVEFCRILSSRSDELAAGRAYRLPTEAEWEYACRAGSTTRFHFGDEMTPLAANCMHYYQSTLPCGCFAPNDFGLFDVHGQVREWCEDWYHRSYYEISPTADPKGPDLGDNRVMRGGAWDVSSENYCRSGYRVYYGASGRLSGIGFRVVCEVG